jgi:RNA-directed DNA polymerase
MKWSPQRYLEEGLIERERDYDALQAAADQINSWYRSRSPFPVLLTLCHLANRSKVPYEHLRYIVSRGSWQMQYKIFRIRKRSGGGRTISVPGPLLMRAQRWLTQHVLNKAVVHPASHAFSPGASILSCAREHVKARWLIKIDVADFFDSITEIQVYRVFRGMGYNALLSFELARLCTSVPYVTRKHSLRSWQSHYPRAKIREYAGQRELGHLPQGAPSSPMLANLAMKSIDEELTQLAKSFGLRYTRYSDDMTFSTRGDFDRGRAQQVVNEASAILKRKGLFPKRAKTAIVHPGARKVVLGLLVDGAQPRLTKEFRDRLRQHLYYLETRGILAHVKERKFDSVGGLYRHLRGLIDYANMVDQPYARGLLTRLHALPWTSPAVPIVPSPDP